MRSNLLSLKNIATQMDKTQLILATGKKVNSAIDNASSYYQARSLSNRAADLTALLDSMGQGIQTIEAATNTLETATDFLTQAKALATQTLTTPLEVYIPQSSGIIGDASIRNTSLFDGRSNTQAAINQLGEYALAATAANQFYAPGVDKNDINFGQGNWYIPAIGEFMEMYGINAEDLIAGTGGINGENKNKINNALSIINNIDGKANTLTNSHYWSSSEFNESYSWLFNMNTGGRSENLRNDNYYIRCFQFLENCFNPTTVSSDFSSTDTPAPQIGDVMYSDLTYGSADDYDGSKTAVGIITWVSEDGRSAKIISLKDLRFSSSDTINNFNPNDPYNGSVGYTYYTTNDKRGEDIIEIENYDNTKFFEAFKEAVIESTANTEDIEEGYNTSQYISIINQYDSMIKDASYNGVNLLQNQGLKISFNQDKTSSFYIEGKDASSKKLGINTLKWNIPKDIEKSIEELTDAITQIRSISSELGRYYNIVINRQNFTNNLINILETGADNLTLADMNEASAQYLSLQTRQQLAINSLSLASISARSILSLFY